jgi:hypothetical protein
MYWRLTWEGEAAGGGVLFAAANNSESISSWVRISFIDSHPHHE